MHHSKEHILEVLRVIAVTTLEIDQETADAIGLDAKIVDDLGFDSLNIFDFIIQIEKSFEIELSERELMKIKTLQDAVNLIYNTLL